MIILICLGIEGTAEKTGVGIVDSDGNILAMAGKQLFPEEGGIHPRLAAEHHAEWIPKLIPQAIEDSGLSYDDLDEKLRRVFDEKELHEVMLFPPMAGSGICGVFIPQKLLTRLDILNDA